MSKAASDDEHALRPPEIFASISVVSERRSADEISALIGLQPDRAWKIGDRRGKTAIIEKIHGWIVNSRLKNVGFDVEAHVDDLLQRVKPVSEKFALLPEENVVTVHVAIYSETRISMSFERHIPRLISALAARFDIEIYFMPPEEQ